MCQPTGASDGHDTAQVAVERQLVHHLQAVRLRPHPHVAAVARERDLQRLRAGLEMQWRRQRTPAQPEAPVDDHRPRRQMQLAAARVDDEERRRRADPHPLLPLGEQHAHRPVGRDPDVRARVVVGEDPAVAEPVARIALRAPLAHADPVTPAAPVEQVDGARPRHRRRQHEHERGDRCSGPDPHREGERVASSAMRGLLLLTSAVVLVDTIFFAALTPLLPTSRTRSTSASRAPACSPPRTLPARSSAPSRAGSSPPGSA